eukprot:TRINITY_DN95_c0_g1_i2.p2 TRINITY_DN95_c0_g1~~TRINITY_DN95_c0_g1_i2.p2  ORF type:complete len:106 (-),score=10.88 TRINITY_DN95_c0_g1_i2:207-524(-)
MPTNLYAHKRRAETLGWTDLLKYCYPVVVDIVVHVNLQDTELINNLHHSWLHLNESTLLLRLIGHHHLDVWLSLLLRLIGHHHLPVWSHNHLSLWLSALLRVGHH